MFISCGSANGAPLVGDPSSPYLKTVGTYSHEPDQATIIPRSQGSVPAARADEFMCFCLLQPSPQCGS